MVGQIVGDVSLAADQLPVVLQDRVEVLPPVAGGEAVEFVEAAGHGMVGILGAVVPFAEGRRDVAGGVEGVGDRLFVKVQPLGPRAHAMDSAARMVAAGEEFGPGGRAERADEEAIEARTVACQAVQVGRGQVRVAVDADVAPALVVGQDHQDIGGLAQVRTRPGSSPG